MRELKLRGAIDNVGTAYHLTSAGISYLSEIDFAESVETEVPIPIVDPSQSYVFHDFVTDTGFPEQTVERWLKAIERKKQVIFYGPPGTGKSFVAEKVARYLNRTKDGMVETVQFHPAYSYEDFIQGIRPQLAANGGLDYQMREGHFLRFCAEAAQREGTCVLIIDEINRANLARVFGELMFLLEYRDQEIGLAGGKTLRIPDNVRIVGTMNTADRSIALVDHALRRRFASLKLSPEYDVLRQYLHKKVAAFPADNLVKELQRLNGEINDPHYEVGISYFMRTDLAEQIGDIWQMEIEPYLEEYFFDQPAKAREFQWEKVGPRIGV